MTSLYLKDGPTRRSMAKKLVPPDQVSQPYLVPPTCTTDDDTLELNEIMNTDEWDAVNVGLVVQEHVIELQN